MTVDPFSFITGHGSEESSPKEATVKFDRRLWGILNSRFVHNDELWPQYQSIHDMIADALWHRIAFLDSWEPSTIPPTQKQILEIYSQLAIQKDYDLRLSIIEETVDQAIKTLESTKDSLQGKLIAVASARHINSLIPEHKKFTLAPIIGAHARAAECMALELGYQPKEINGLASTTAAHVPKATINDILTGRQPQQQRPQTVELDTPLLPEADRAQTPHRKAGPHRKSDMGSPGEPLPW